MTVRIVHGANEDHLDFAGKTIGQLKRSLREVFNIPPEAVAYCCGDLASQQYLIEEGDTIEFVREQGVKGLGRLLSSNDLKSELSISDEQYNELLEQGLPIITLSNDEIRHPEFSVDKFLDEFSKQQSTSIQVKRDILKEVKSTDKNKNASLLKKPDWDGAKLFVNGELIKRYKNPAIHQKKILNCFQEENWSEEIDDPFELQQIEKKCDQGMKSAELDDWMAKRRGAVAELNKMQKVILFTSLGDGRGVKWEWSID